MSTRMSTVLRIGGYVVALLAAFAVALGVGRLIGPLELASADGHGGGEHGGDEHAHAPAESTAEAGAAGLETTQDGFSLRLADDELAPGRQRLEFVVTDPEGRPVTSYEEQHEKDLHLIVVRRDLTGYQHLHPTLDPDSGEWSVEADLTPGTWRVLADTLPTGSEPVVLGTDLSVPGRFAPEPLGQDRADAEVDGYDVTLGGSFTAGADTMLTATVSRGGDPVTDLDPYLGANGHLVALRSGDLGYLHVHPEESETSGPTVSFHTQFPSAGRYRLFLDFQHEGEVRTAEFTVTVGESHGEETHGEESHAEEKQGEEGGHDH